MPQVSILSHMLFNICMKLLGEVVQGLADVNRMPTFFLDSGEAAEFLNRCLEPVMGEGQ